MKKNLIVTSILVVVAIALIGGGVFYMSKKKNSSGMIASVSGVLSSQEAGNKAIDYINKNLLQSGTTASLKEIKEENGLYKITLKILQSGSEQEGIIYTSRDGKLLFVYPPVEIDKEIPKATATQPVKTDKPDVKLFVMAFCPYGNEAETLIKPVLDLLKDKISLSLHYIVSKDDNGKYSSLHGDQELHQDVREICVAKYQNDKFWDFVAKINEKCTSQNVDTCWEQVAKDLGIDTQKITDCQKNEADSLLAEELKLTGQFNVSGSPTLVINGVEFTGDRSSEGYKTGICNAFNTAPQECSQTLSTSGGTVEGGCGQ
jgi:glutaredoxin